MVILANRISWWFIYFIVYRPKNKTATSCNLENPLFFFFLFFLFIVYSRIKNAKQPEMDTGKCFRVKYLFQSSLNVMKIWSLVQENCARYQVLKSLACFSLKWRKKQNKYKINGGSWLQQLQSLGMLLSEETVFCAYSHWSSLALGHGPNCNHRNGAHFIWWLSDLASCSQRVAQPFITALF